MMSDLRRDLGRYSWRAFYSDANVWALVHYRVGQTIVDLGGPMGAVLRALHSIVGVLVRGLSGVEIGRGAKIGGGLRIEHGFGIVIHSATVMGRDCRIRHGVTIGVRRTGGGAPVIGDEVEFGAYAQVLGEITVGDGAMIGAMALVVDDVPARAVAYAAKAGVDLRSA